MARLDDPILDALGGRSREVRLSRQTADKQVARHPELAPDDYGLVQVLIDHGTAVLEKKRTLVFVGETGMGKWWRAVVKRTADERRTYLVTFHRIKRNQVAAARRRGTVVRREKNE